MPSGIFIRSSPNPPTPRGALCSRARWRSDPRCQAAACGSRIAAASSSGASGSVKPGGRWRRRLGRQAAARHAASCITTRCRASRRRWPPSRQPPDVGVGLSSPGQPHGALRHTHALASACVVSVLPRISRTISGVSRRPRFVPHRARLLRALAALDAPDFQPLAERLAGAGARMRGVHAVLGRAAQSARERPVPSGKSLPRARYSAAPPAKLRLAAGVRVTMCRIGTPRVSDGLMPAAGESGRPAALAHGIRPCGCRLGKVPGWWLMPRHPAAAPPERPAPARRTGSRRRAMPR